MDHISGIPRFRGKLPALTLGVGIMALVVGAANSAPIVKECSKDGKFIIGFSQANNAEPYRQHVNDELTAAAKKVPQFTLQIADGAGNVNTQTSQMDNFITQKVDLILISPFEAAPLTPVIARAMKAGIPQEKTAFGLNQLCGSGLRAVALGLQQIGNGDADIIVVADADPGR